MKAKLTLENGKIIDMELTKEQEELVNQSDKKTGYEKVIFGDTYYASDNTGLTKDNTNIVAEQYIGDYFDNARYDNADYYNDETLAKNIARADTLMRKLRRFAVENGGSFTKEEWKSYDDKYYFYYDYEEHDFYVLKNESYVCKDLFTIYFRSEEIAQKAIDTFKEDLLWYFTEYDDMLR